MNRRILLVSPPFSGHLHPLLGIGKGLREIAEVILLSSPSASSSAESTGIPFRPILAHREDVVRQIANPGHEVKSHPWRLYRQLKANLSLLSELKAELESIYDDLRPDLVLADFTVPVAGSVTLARGIRWWTTLPSPCVFETPDGPPAYFGGLMPARSRVQGIAHAALRSGTRGFKRSMGWLFRRELGAAGFGSVYRADGSEAVYSPQSILALGIPEIEFPRTYPPHFEFVGPVLETPPDPSDPPAFAGDGRPHVLATLGTHLPHLKDRFAAALRLFAERNPGIVIHLSRGGTLPGTAPGLENWRDYRNISYQNHLSRYDLVVHHAGAGVLNHCLRHGIPSVVVPQDYDQFDNAARLVASGLALRAGTFSEIGTVLLRALGDRELRGRCLEMSGIHARHDAVRVIREKVGRCLPAKL